MGRKDLLWCSVEHVILVSSLVSHNTVDLVVNIIHDGQKSVLLSATVSNVMNDGVRRKLCHPPRKSKATCTIRHYQGSDTRTTDDRAKSVNGCAKRIITILHYKNNSARMALCKQTRTVANLMVMMVHGGTERTSALATEHQAMRQTFWTQHLSISWMQLDLMKNLGI